MLSPRPTTARSTSTLNDETIELNAPTRAGVTMLLSIVFTLLVAFALLSFFPEWESVIYIAAPFMVGGGLRRFADKFVRLTWDGEKVEVQRLAPWQFFRRTAVYRPGDVSLVGSDVDVAFMGEVEWTSARDLFGRQAPMDFDQSENRRLWISAAHLILKYFLIVLCPVTLTSFVFFELVTIPNPLWYGIGFGLLRMFWPYDFLILTADGLRDVNVNSSPARLDLDISSLEKAGFKTD